MELIIIYAVLSVIIYCYEIVHALDCNIRYNISEKQEVRIKYKSDLYKMV